MTKLIAICDGHGMNTPGKRTPKFADGTVMLENEFNKRVKQLLEEELVRCGFKTVIVAPGDDDVPLLQRVRAANQAKADLYVSIHANALQGIWGNWGGIETYVYPSGESLRIGRIIHRHLLKGTSLRNRGVKDGSHLYVINNTMMPAVLVECGFMDNLKEAKLLRTAEYRLECATEIAEGICEAFGVQYVPRPANVVIDEKPEEIPKLRLTVNGREVNIPLKIESGRTFAEVDGYWIQLRGLANLLTATIEWDEATRTVKLIIE